MKKAIFGLLLCVVSVQLAHAQASLPTSTTGSPTKSEGEILQLSKTKWRAHSGHNTDGAHAGKRWRNGRKLYDL